MCLSRGLECGSGKMAFGKRDLCMIPNLDSLMYGGACG